MIMNLDRWSETQRDAITASGCNVLVSAGAGSGKTSVLVERIIHTVMGHRAIDMKNLLVVTFTEAAAAEMRARIGERFGRMYQELSAAGDITAAGRAAAQLAQLEQAQVSTLHSFCMDVVRRNFLLLGIDASFDLLDEQESRLLRHRTLTKLLQSTEPATLQNLLSLFGRGRSDVLLSLISKLDNFSRSQANPGEWLRKTAQVYTSARFGAFDELSVAEPFRQFILFEIRMLIQHAERGRALAEAYPELSKYHDNLAVVLCEAHKLLMHFEATVRIEGVEDGLAALRGAFSSRVSGPSSIAQKEAVKKARDEAKAIFNRLSDVLGRGEAELKDDMERMADIVSALMRLTEQFREDYLVAKQQRGKLDFNDLEHFALRALSEPATGEARRLQARFAEVLVDEYQDTSPIQEAIVESLTRSEGNTFVVGDVKQSIYRFRMAEPKLFLHRLRHLQSGQGKAIMLQANYRSRRTVVDAVNYLFSHIFTSDFGGIAYREEAQMLAGAKYGSDPRDLNLPVEVHLLARQSAPVEAEDDASTELNPSEDWSPIHREAAVTAQRILELMGRDGDGAQRQVWDAKTSSFRPLQYRDIVILLRSVKGKVQPVLDVLEQFSIPAYGASSTGFYDAMEIRFVVAALRAIDNPRRDLSLAVLLRSPLAGFNDEDLARIRTFPGRTLMDCLQTAARESDVHQVGGLQLRVAAFLSRLAKWRSLARESTAEQVLVRICTDTRLLSYLGAMQRGNVRVANLRQFIEYARQYDAKTTDGVFGFISTIQESQSLEADYGEARTMGEQEDVVRIMTIHQSKGLEFPVVFVLDLGRQFKSAPSDDTVLLHAAYGLGAEYRDIETARRWRTLPMYAIRHAERVETMAEEARILYVALTRAREHLILIGSAPRLQQAIPRLAANLPANVETLPLQQLVSARSMLDFVLPPLVHHEGAELLWKWLSEYGEAEMEGSDNVENDGSGWDASIVPSFREDDSRFTFRLWGLPGANAIPVPPRLSTSVHGETENVEESRNLFVTTHDKSPDAFLAALQGELSASLDERQVSEESDAVREALTWNDRSESLAGVPGKVSATELRRLWTADKVAISQRFRQGQAAERLLDDPAFVRTARPSREEGTMFHRVMQMLDLRTVPSVQAVEAEVERLIRVGKLTVEEAETAPVERVTHFLSTAAGRRLGFANQVFREQPFYLRLPVPEGFRRDLASSENAPYVTAQGVMDVVALDETGALLVDYKTDNVTADSVPSQAAAYQAQVQTYAHAIRAASGLPVDAYLYFVRPGVLIRVQELELSAILSPLLSLTDKTRQKDSRVSESSSI